MSTRCAALLLFILASPAAAQGEGHLAEGTSLIGIGLAVLGVLIGRRASMRPRPKPAPSPMAERETVPAHGGQPPAKDI